LVELDIQTKTTPLNKCCNLNLINNLKSNKDFNEADILSFSIMAVTGQNKGGQLPPEEERWISPYELRSRMPLLFYFPDATTLWWIAAYSENPSPNLPPEAHKITGQFKTAPNGFVRYIHQFPKKPYGQRYGLN